MALVEFFDVPILKAFSGQQAYEIFGVFPKVKISNHQPGFWRMADIVPALTLIEPFLGWFGQRVKDM